VRRPRASAVNLDSAGGFAASGAKIPLLQPSKGAFLFALPALLCGHLLPRRRSEFRRGCAHSGHFEGIAGSNPEEVALVGLLCLRAAGVAFAVDVQDEIARERAFTFARSQAIWTSTLSPTSRAPATVSASGAPLSSARTPAMPRDSETKPAASCGRSPDLERRARDDAPCRSVRADDVHHELACRHEVMMIREGLLHVLPAPRNA